MERNNHIVNEMKQCELYAMYWIHAASNGTAALRMISFHDGQRNRYMTKEELNKEAMDTALHHIQRRAELMEKLS